MLRLLAVAHALGWRLVPVGAWLLPGLIINLLIADDFFSRSLSLVSSYVGLVLLPRSAANFLL